MKKLNVHSGAGRFTVVEMQTMAWQEMGYSSGQDLLIRFIKRKYN